MGKFVSKVLKTTFGLADKLTGTKIGSGISDKFLGTDIQGNKAAQADAQAREAALNQKALNAQQNQNGCRKFSNQTSVDRLALGRSLFC